MAFFHLLRRLYNLKISHGLEVFPNAHFTRSSVYLLFMAVALVLKMHLVRSIKLTLKPHWLHRLHNLTPNLLEMGSGGGVTPPIFLLTYIIFPLPAPYFTCSYIFSSFHLSL